MTRGDESEQDPLLDFIFEVGQLKKVPRSGWLKIGVGNPESVAEHSFRTAIIGYLLSLLEGVDTGIVVISCLFHDLGEARTLDLDWVAQNYAKDSDHLDSEVLTEQFSSLPPEIRTSLEEIAGTGDYVSKEVSDLVWDADKLEAAFQAVEYYSIGHTNAEEWVQNSKESIRTTAGKEIFQSLLKAIEKDEVGEIVKWWKGLT